MKKQLTMLAGAVLAVGLLLALAVGAQAAGHARGPDNFESECLQNYPDRCIGDQGSGKVLLLENASHGAEWEAIPDGSYVGRPVYEIRSLSDKCMVVVVHDSEVHLDANPCRPTDNQERWIPLAKKSGGVQYVNVAVAQTERQGYMMTKCRDVNCYLHWGGTNGTYNVWMGIPIENGKGART